MISVLCFTNNTEKSKKTLWTDKNHITCTTHYLFFGNYGFLFVWWLKSIYLKTEVKICIYILFLDHRSWYRLVMCYIGFKFVGGYPVGRKIFFLLKSLRQRLCHMRQMHWSYSIQWLPMSSSPSGLLKFEFFI